MKKRFQILCSSILVALSLGVCFIANATNNVKEVKVDAEAYDPVLTLAEKVKGDKKEKPTLPSGLDKWDGTSSEAYAGGNGTEASPYQIANGKQLMQLKKDLATSNTSVLYYELTNDIDLDNHDIMIGAYTNAGTFPGVFDGNNHTIYNYLYNGGTTGSNHALFGQVTGTVKNLTLVGSMTGKDRMAGIIRNLKGGKLYNLNSFVDITATLSEKAQGYVGGLCGSSNADNSVMENCNNYGNIIFKGIGTEADGGLSVGGVISYAGFGSKTISVKNCNNYGNIQASLCRGVGGVAGFYLTGSFDNCHNYGLIKTTGDCRYVGGFIGVVGTTSSILSINNCFNYGHVDLRVGTLTYKDHFIGYEWPTATITITNSEHGATKAWNESVTTSAFEGSGTEEDPYLIQSGSDLKYLADQVAASNHFAGKYFKQTENIYLNGKSIMIGTYSTAASTVDANYFKNSFAGHYDGNNKCVAGYFYSSASGNNYSLFGHINKGSVKNLVTTGFISARDRVSGAIRAINNATVENVTSYVDIYCATSLTANVGYVGGVISATSGNASNDVVNNVTNYGNITFEGTNAPTENDSQGIGGVVGYLVDKAAAKGSLSNLVNFGDVYASNQRIGTGGGLGVCNYNNVTKVYNFGNVTNVTADVTKVGGVVGTTVSATYTNCYNYGNIEAGGNAADAYCGGVIGVLSSSSIAKQIYNYGDVKAIAYAASHTGGLIGGVITASKVTDSESHGNVTAHSHAGLLTDYVGVNSIANFEDMYATGDIYLTKGTETATKSAKKLVATSNNKDVVKYVNGVEVGFASVIAGNKYSPTKYSTDNEFIALNSTKYAANAAKNDRNVAIEGKPNVTWYTDATFKTPYVEQAINKDIVIYGKAVTDAYLQLVEDIKNCDVCEDYNDATTFRARIAELDEYEQNLILTESITTEYKDHGESQGNKENTIGDRLTYMESLITQHNNPSSGLLNRIQNSSEISITLLAVLSCVISLGLFVFFKKKRFIK